MSLAPYQPYLDFIASQQTHMVHQLYEWSNINSGSRNLQGLARMAAILEDNFFWLNAPIERIALAPMTVMGDDGTLHTQALGECLRLRMRPHAPIQVVLVGHYDTVFDEKHPFQRAQFIDEQTLNGPGVADLKGGLLVMLKALEAFEKSPWASAIGYEVILNPDEEIGSVGSDVVLKAAAQHAQFGLIFEPALPDGTLAGARKGSGNFSVHITGKAAHAGRNPHEGRNAVVAASTIAVRLFALQESQARVLINPANIIGGGALNMVPEHAVLRFNVRTHATEDEAWFMQQLAEMTAEFSGHNGFTCHVEGGFTRTPKPMSHSNQALFSLLKDTGALLNQPIAWRDSGGACDGNNLYKYGVPNIDTLGVCGGAIHSDKEFVTLSSLTERAQLTALLLMRLASGELHYPDILSKKPL